MKGKFVIIINNLIMVKPRFNKKDAIKQQIFKCLRAEHAFWSYDQNDVDLNSISDDQLIALAMRYLDLKEIKMLFEIYPMKQIKSAWRRLLVPEGEYLYTLNRFFAWYFFKSKQPDAYLKSLETRRMNQIAFQ